MIKPLVLAQTQLNSHILRVLLGGWGWGHQSRLGGPTGANAAAPTTRNSSLTPVFVLVPIFLPSQTSCPSVSFVCSTQAMAEHLQSSQFWLGGLSSRLLGHCPDTHFCW